MPGHWNRRSGRGRFRRRRSSFSGRRGGGFTRRRRGRVGRNRSVRPLRIGYRF